MITIEAIAHLNARGSPNGSSSGARRARQRLLADRPLVLAAENHLELPRGGLGLPDDDLGAGGEALVVEPMQEVAVVLGEPHDLGGAARSQVRQRSQLLFSACSKAGSTASRGQRSGLPSFASIRATMSSVNVSPSSSAWTCASAAV